MKSLSSDDARNIDRIFNKEINKVVPNGFIPKNYDIISDIKGKTANPQFAYCKEPVYAFSNKQIALLLPMIMESPIAYNQINERFEFTVDLERHSLITELDGSRTPPNQGDRDSGYDSNSPPKKDYGSSSGGPGLSTEPSDMEWEPSTHLQNGSISGVPNGHLSSDEEPRSSLEQPQVQRLPTWNQEEALEEFLRQVPYNVGAAEVDAVQNMPAGPSAWSQPIGFWSSPTPSAEPSLWPQSRPLSRKGANESGSAWTSQPIGFRSSQSTSSGFSDSLWVQSEPSSSKGADESMRTGKSIWYASSSHSPGVEDVNDVEPEKQQVSDGCSEAKSQKSESTKKRRGGLSYEEIKKLILAKFSPFKRRSVERDTMCSSKSDLGPCATKKPPLSERSASERRAKSNLPSKETSPTHEGAPGGLKPLTSDEKKELCPLLCDKLKKKLDSNSLENPQLIYLLYTLSGKRELSRFLYEGKQSQLSRLTEAQLSSPDNSSSKRDSDFCSMGSPAVPHKGSVPSKVKECRTQRVKPHLVEHV